MSGADDVLFFTTPTKFYEILRLELGTAAEYRQFDGNGEIQDG